MRAKLIVFILAAALAVTAVSFAAAINGIPPFRNQPDCADCPMPAGRGQMHNAGIMPHCPRMGMMMGTSPAALVLDMQDKLQLDDKQAEKLREMDAQFRTKQVDRRASIEKKMIQVQQALAKDAKAEDVRPMIDEISKEYGEVVVAWIDGKEKALQVLTEEQKQAFRKEYGMQKGAMRGMGRRPQAQPKGEEAPG